MAQNKCYDDCNKCPLLLKGKTQAGCLLGYKKIFFVSKKDKK